jgi:hypothetical protein
MRRLATALLAVLVLTLASCTEANIEPQDAYRVGCPALDGAVASGSVTKKATVAGLRRLSESGRLDPEPQRWIDAVISVLTSSTPEDIPADTRQLIIDGCAKNGYPLQNLK